ncbi:high-affinity choline transporter 1 isoform X1 [Patella vulgata]|uniref:high-affinity choline transporter 1 isoform X1 n=2 Tax=Patella vulgata TaxID=6465 RepID=UPI0024A9B854|nr:high-affinity choline transporter 1 isoform X1 [Patella vulgata]XP_055958980.1 high-affinity choline transporter 1 isoform X1 [Patella vulgata]
MSVNIPALAVLAVFYIIILVVGIVAGRKVKLNNCKKGSLEANMVAGRDLNVCVGIFTMMATTVGGGYINGVAESVATSGIVWTLAPLGIFLGLIAGGVIYARRMREKKYLTMLDPFQQRYGSVVVILIYLASLCGDIFWTASILSALGSSLAVMTGIDRPIAVCVSSGITVIYTMIGQMIAVAYTDIIQLLFIIAGLGISLPFIFTNENTGNISNSSCDWLGHMEAKDSGVWIDLLIAMSFGTIPWQAYFQRVLSVRSGKQAQILSITGAFGALILVLPSIFIGAVATSANWNSTSLGNSPMVLNKSSDVLPYVLQEFTPPVISLLGLGAISAAVMSSMDSAILGSSSMFTHNIYSNILRKQASQVELQIIQRLAIICLGSLATVISLSVPILYGLFILAADVVFVIVLPQLTCAIFLQRTNTYGAIGGFLAGFILRVGAGEPNFQLPAFIFYPKYDPELGQLFPFRTFAMVCSFVTIVIVSELVQLIKRKSVCSCSSSSNTEYNYNIVDESKSRKCCHVKSDDLEELTSL